MRARRAPQQLVHQVVAVPPPVRGLNTTGQYAGMPASDAVEMDNLLSTDLGVSVRGGWREYATKVDNGSHIKTLMVHTSAPPSSLAPPLASSTLFAATDHGIWNVEGGGDKTGAAAAVTFSGATNAGQCSYAQFTAGGGKQYLIVCSETDGTYHFDGTAWTKWSQVTTPTVPGQISGADPTLFAHVCAWKHRLLFTKRGSAEVYYLPVNQMGGAAQLLDFGGMLQRGGMVLGCANWTMDGGDGVDDRLVIIASSGDIAVYAGTTPGSDFGNVGVWNIGMPPIGRRCFTTTGGNVYILTTFGVIPLVELMQGGLDSIITAGTEYLQQLRKIQNQLNTDFQTLIATPGWQLISIPSLALLHIARPATSVTDVVQYAFQQHSLAWSRIVDMPGYCFLTRLAETYSSTEDGRVLRVFDGSTDGQKLDGTGAYEIRSRLTPAFNDFGAPAQLKRAQLIRAQFVAKAVPGYSVMLNIDYEINPTAGSPIGGTTSGSMWDLSYWDRAIWSGGRSASGEWRTVAGLGYALAPTFFLATMAPTTLASIEYMTDAGGPL